jgi:hypothetical protein
MKLLDTLKRIKNYIIEYPGYLHYKYVINAYLKYEKSYSEYLDEIEKLDSSNYSNESDYFVNDNKINYIEESDSFDDSDSCTYYFLGESSSPKKMN